MPALRCCEALHGGYERGCELALEARLPESSLLVVFTCRSLQVTGVSLQVIYELTQGERQLIEDLSLVKKVADE